MTVEGATKLIEAFTPDLAGEPVAALAEGWDNTVFDVGGHWAFRFLRRRTALPGIMREIAILPAIAHLLPLAIPVPEFIAEDLHPEEPWPFTGGRLIRGTELAEAGLPVSSRGTLAASLGAFLRTLHSTATRDIATETGAVLLIDAMQRAWPRSQFEQTREGLDRLVTSRVWRKASSTISLLDEASTLNESTQDRVLVHGDLHVRHLLVDTHGSAVGVIDWGDMCLADPSVDLAIAFSAFEGASRTELLTSYGPVGPETELRARAFAIHISVLLADYAVQVGQPRLLVEALAGLERAVH